MGRHTVHLSEDWSRCTRCDQDLENGVRMCCGSGSKHVCSKCMKTKKRGKDWGWAIGTNKYCDEHLAKTDFKFPKEFPDCEHILAEKKKRDRS